MTRKEALQNLIKTVFGILTISEKDGMLIKDKSCIQNCNYTPKSFEHIKQLFKVAFIDPEPKYSDYTLFDQQIAITNAKKYLNARKISLSRNDNPQLQNRQIYEYLVNYFLKEIVIADSKNKKEAENQYINDKLLDTIKSARQNASLQEFSDLFQDTKRNTLDLNDTDLDKSNDNCNYHLTVHRYDINSFKIIDIFKESCITIPCNSKPIFSDEELIDMLFDRHHIESKELDDAFQTFPLFYWNEYDYDYDTLSISWNTSINYENIFTNKKYVSLGCMLDDYHKNLYNKAKEQVEIELSKRLHPCYESISKQLEHIISEILSLKYFDDNWKNNINSLSSNKFRDFLYRKCEHIFFDFEMPYLLIEKAYCDNITKGLYILIQNTVLELTDLINVNCIEISKQFKTQLTSESFRRHKKFIENTTKSKYLSNIIDLEKKYSSLNCTTKVPKKINDFFFVVREKTFSNFKSALYRYDEQLKTV